MQRRYGGTTVTVPVPNHRELKQGTLRGIIKQAGLSTEPFEQRQ